LGVQFIDGRGRIAFRGRLGAIEGVGVNHDGLDVRELTRSYLLTVWRSTVAHTLYQ